MFQQTHCPPVQLELKLCLPCLQLSNCWIKGWCKRHLSFKYTHRQVCNSIAFSTCYLWNVIIPKCNVKITCLIGNLSCGFFQIFYFFCLVDVYDFAMPFCYSAWDVDWNLMCKCWVYCWVYRKLFLLVCIYVSMLYSINDISTVCVFSNIMQTEITR